MKILVLGAAAGGGFPQWNCNCDNCHRVRQGDPALKPRTQSSLAVSANGNDWILLNASPDIRQQLFENAALHPSDGRRHSPIKACLLTNADVDHTAGLLTLRERQPFNLYATQRIHDVLTASPVFNVMQAGFVDRHAFALNQPIRPTDPQGNSLGLEVTPFAIPGKVALYLEDTSQENFGSVDEDTIGLRVEAINSGKHFFYLPGCAAMPDWLSTKLANAPMVFMDASSWVDDEMSRQGVGEKTAARMGHMPVSGDNGSMAAFRPLNISRKVYIHINNTNPILDENSEQHHEACADGWTIAIDGQEFTL